MTLTRARSKIARFALPLAAAIGLGVAAYRPPSVPHGSEAALSMRARLGTRTLDVLRGDRVLKEYPIAIGSGKHRTPVGRFTVRKLVWNPAWRPPNAAWARGRKPAAPGAAANPMRTVKIFFQEPDYYIHGTDDLDSLGEAASHGCLRMDPDQAAQLALLLMDNAGISRDWDWVLGILDMGEQRTVNLGTPTPLTILP